MRRLAALEHDAIAEAIVGGAYQYANEKEWQEQIALELDRAGLHVEREVTLLRETKDTETYLGRIDFVVGRVGIEVKVDGAMATVKRQLNRYCRCQDLDRLILVTNRHHHLALGGKVEGKQVTVLYVVRPF